MAVTNRTLTELLQLALLWQLPLVTSPELSAPEQAQINENRLRCQAALNDVNPNTNLVPQNRRQAHTSALQDRVRATTIIDDLHFANAPGVLYDALDAMAASADLIINAIPSTLIDFSTDHP